MKNLPSLLTYLSALIIGILLLVFCDKADLLQGIIIAMGIVILIPSIVMLIRCIVPKKEKDGTRDTTSWYSVMVAIAGLALGAWLLISPGFFINATVYTLAAVVILAGIVGWVFIVQHSRPYGASIGWYVVPALMICGGVVLCLLGTKVLGMAANITAGVLLVVYAVNGMAAYGREARSGAKSST